MAKSEYGQYRVESRAGIYAVGRDRLAPTETHAATATRRLVKALDSQRFHVRNAAYKSILRAWSLHCRMTSNDYNKSFLSSVCYSSCAMKRFKPLVSNCNRATS